MSLSENVVEEYASSLNVVASYVDKVFINPVISFYETKKGVTLTDEEKKELYQSLNNSALNDSVKRVASSKNNSRSRTKVAKTIKSNGNSTKDSVAKDSNELSETRVNKNGKEQVRKPNGKGWINIGGAAHLKYLRAGDYNSLTTEKYKDLLIKKTPKKRGGNKKNKDTPKDDRKELPLPSYKEPKSKARNGGKTEEVGDSTELDEMMKDSEDEELTSLGDDFHIGLKSKAVYVKKGDSIYLRYKCDDGKWRIPTDEEIKIVQDIKGGVCVEEDYGQYNPEEDRKEIDKSVDFLKVIKDLSEELSEEQVEHHSKVFGISYVKVKHDYTHNCEKCDFGSNRKTELTAHKKKEKH